MQEVPVGLKGDAAVISVMVLFAAAVEQHAIRRLFVKNTKERAFVICLKLAYMIFIACCDHCVFLRKVLFLTVQFAHGVLFYIQSWNYTEVPQASHVVRCSLYIEAYN